MGYSERYEYWLSSDVFDAETKAELRAITDEKEIEDRFYTPLQFGTAGLRGIMGAGDNRMNVYTVGKAACGLAKYLCGQSSGKEITVAIAYDGRHNGKKFALTVAANMLRAGIKVLMFRTLAPTPLLAFAVRKFGCDAGFMITASHNTKIYNGLKVFDGEGKQPLSHVTDGMMLSIESTSYEEAETSSEKWASHIEYMSDDVKEDFIQTTLDCGILDDPEAKAALKVVYTPLHGTGEPYVIPVLQRAGFIQSFTEPEQAVVSGDFPSVESPNPEEEKALKLSMAMGDTLGADIVIATDPDSDRLGMAVMHNGKMKLINGNLIGALLAEHVFSRKKLPKVPVLVKTIVTGDMAALFAQSKGATVYETLTGFKNIVSVIPKLDASKGEEFVMGYEESHGYVAAPHLRDKDGVSAALLICEAAAYWKKRGKTLVDVLEDMYAQFSRRIDCVDYTVFPGLDGIDIMNALLAELRKDPHKYLEGIAEVKDYLKGIDGVEKADVLKFIFNDGSFMACRRSGTEPKIKFYYSIVCATEAEGYARLDGFRKIINNIADKERETKR